MVKVMCFGAFDLLHKGHEFYLKEAKKLGDFLVVVVALDSTVLAVKGRLPVNGQSARLENLKQLGIADRVVLGNRDDVLKVIDDENPDVVCFGYDQGSFTGQAEEKLQKKRIRVVRLPAFHPETYKSSLLRKK